MRAISQCLRSSVRHVSVYGRSISSLQLALFTLRRSSAFALVSGPLSLNNELTTTLGCGPCRLVNPVLEEIDAEYGSGRSSFGEGKGRNDGYQVESLSVVAINTDDADPAVVNAWGVESIPTLLLVR